ncbi:hypothetical protein AVEN_18451-1 [Araneus ventricosus]|uniref:Uncharacterized protein n=1 Tax=Araneus ventricosus TaxID=182803 RepID=A0A4Y2MKK5_ARAVE|nr:hypothetical protein AVEN_18451-1 [Araneus ventricosus]
MLPFLQPIRFLYGLFCFILYPFRKRLSRIDDEPGEGEVGSSSVGRQQPDSGEILTLNVRPTAPSPHHGVRRRSGQRISISSITAGILIEGNSKKQSLNKRKN